MEKGVVFEMTNYDKKGKEVSVATHTVVDKVVDGDDIMVEVSTVVQPVKKGDPIQFDYQVQCVDGKFQVNMFKGLSSEQMSGMQGSMELEGDYLSIPENMSEGDRLDDATIYLKFATEESEGAMMRFRYDITNRVVEKEETLTTPAGTFDTYKISYDVAAKIVITLRSSAAEWYSEGVGIVKSESYNKKGKIQGYSLLTKFSN